MSTESAFSANMRVSIAGHDVQVTVRGDSAGEFEVHWAELEEKMPSLIESVQLVTAAVNAQSLVASAPSNAPGSVDTNPWTPTATAAPVVASADPWGASAATEQAPVCDHGQPMKKVPAGVSKKTGQPYKGFWACAAPSKDQACKRTITI